ncbi:alpha,alpha-phosphotrehalase [Pediococcus acidilactici]|uniref:alpha,alpha-phosphotrehalase n=1 Tax=Pediococcus acidilactici TaxID=1254 RepID=UPI0013211E15|nr:alpha,alpha-phosphotrehalase [Pediococcus acidilactici]KAF0369797.1 alpha,alpha-phosphotrehalase [Pediococcus acidilactici]KAF0388374.1 alpha,alpha-phosphotrehalase [Pediococcus acidilactici]
MNFKNKVIYQIYPKSFYDSNNDGIGDLRGIIKKIPYLTKLHVDMIWFNPFFVSPQYDNGYDIANYYQIDPVFGTMDDFEELVQKLKAQHIEVMLDMVLNHVSTDHEWFQKALAGNQRYQNYFYIRKAKADGSVPNNWTSKFGGTAWAKFGNTDNYYLHLYDKHQADLNWHNPEVRKELFKVINFWHDKGVKGFRFDVINVTGKDTVLRDAPAGVESKFMYTDTPIVQDYLKEMNQAALQDPEIITVGEFSSASVTNGVKYTRPDEHELTMAFTFHHLKVDYDHGQKWTKIPFDFAALKQTLNEWQVGMNKGNGWNALFWNNHDQPWALNRFGDPVHYREKSAEMLATTIHLLRGTPYIYQGEEIGMSDPNYQSIDDYVDVEALNAYHTLLKSGHSPQDALAIVKSKARDSSRVPMHWDNTKYAGFSKVKPWLKPTNQQNTNVDDELRHGEIFNYYQKLINLRKQFKIISEGDYQPFELAHPTVFAYLRTYQSQRLLVLNNFYGKVATISIPEKFTSPDANILINNYSTPERVSNSLRLEPYQSLAILV